MLPAEEVTAMSTKNTERMLADLNPPKKKKGVWGVSYIGALMGP